MTDVLIRKAGRAGHITLNRPDALNALTYPMILEIEQALDAWAEDPEISLVLIDAAGVKAFCAGGDIVEMYETASTGDFEYGRRFWADEYRLNAKIFHYPKPYVALMQGFTMGGGVGVSCHGSHRVVCETSQIAMPECGIGLIPDVGGSLMLGLAPGRLGEYLGTTAARMGPADAIYAGFADTFVPQDKWPELRGLLCENGDADGSVTWVSEPAPQGAFETLQPKIDRHFAGETLGDICRSLDHDPSEFAEQALKALGKVSPLSAAATVEIVHRVRGAPSIQAALEMEYRFTYRSAENGDFIEGIRAMVIDKDRSPNWRHPDPRKVPLIDVSKMLMPLGENALDQRGGLP